MKNLIFSLMVFSFSLNLLAQTEDTVLLVSQPEKIKIQEKETSNATDITGFYQQPNQPSYLKIPPPKLKDMATEKLEDDQEDNTNYFVKRTQGTIQGNYSEFSNDYVISRTISAYVSLTQPSHGGTYDGGAVSHSETDWSYNDLADYPDHWGFTGHETQWGGYYVIQSSGKKVSFNYEAWKFGFIYTFGHMDGGYRDKVHLQKNYSKGEVFVGYETDLYNSEAAKGKKIIDFINRASFLIHGTVPVSSTATTKLDGVLQPKEKKTDADRWKIYTQLEFSLLSFPIFQKKAGIVIGGHGSYQHQGKALNIWGAGVTLKVDYKYNELLKFMAKIVSQPADETPTGSSIFWSAGADIWNFLRMTGWSIFNK